MKSFLGNLETRIKNGDVDVLNEMSQAGRLANKLCMKDNIKHKKNKKNKISTAQPVGVTTATAACAPIDSVDLLEDFEDAIRCGEVAQVKSFLRSSPEFINATFSSGMKVSDLIEVYTDVYKDDPEKNKLYKVYNACKSAAKKKK